MLHAPHGEARNHVVAIDHRDHDVQKSRDQSFIDAGRSPQPEALNGADLWAHQQREEGAHTCTQGVAHDRDLIASLVQVQKDWPNLLLQPLGGFQHAPVREAVLNLLPLRIEVGDKVRHRRRAGKDQVGQHRVPVANQRVRTLNGARGRLREHDLGAGHGLPEDALHVRGRGLLGHAEQPHQEVQLPQQSFWRPWDAALGIDVLLELQHRHLAALAPVLAHHVVEAAEEVRRSEPRPLAIDHAGQVHQELKHLHDVVSRQNDWSVPHKVVAGLDHSRDLAYRQEPHDLLQPTQAIGAQPHRFVQLALGCVHERREAALEKRIDALHPLLHVQTPDLLSDQFLAILAGRELRAQRFFGAREAAIGGTRNDDSAVPAVGLVAMLALQSRRAQHRLAADTASAGGGILHDARCPRSCASGRLGSACSNACCRDSDVPRHARRRGGRQPRLMPEVRRRSHLSQIAEGGVVGT
mmetsp:Transcript_22478/g.77021  ORF Transcript_22478/g.77021 Transcript_22478/m.77021 type:complete len:468 (-) Transcript_22478:109-1512(-)